MILLVWHGVAQIQSGGEASHLYINHSTGPDFWHFENFTTIKQIPTDRYMGWRDSRLTGVKDKEL